MNLVGSLFVQSSAGLQEIAIQECTARSEIESYISLTRPVCVVNIEII